MTLLLVVGSLGLLLALACWWEAHRGKPAWNVHPRRDQVVGPTAHHAARSAKRSVAATTASAAFFGIGLDGDG